MPDPLNQKAGPRARLPPAALLGAADYQLTSARAAEVAAGTHERTTLPAVSFAIVKTPPVLDFDATV